MRSGAGGTLPGNAELQLGIHVAIYCDDARRWSEANKAWMNLSRGPLLGGPRNCPGSFPRDGSRGGLARYPLLQCMNAERATHVQPCREVVITDTHVTFHYCSFEIKYMNEIQPHDFDFSDVFSSCCDRVCGVNGRRRLGCRRLRNRV